jgi:hypothetical protein
MSGRCQLSCYASRRTYGGTEWTQQLFAAWTLLPLCAHGVRRTGRQGVRALRFSGFPQVSQPRGEGFATPALVLTGGEVSSGGRVAEAVAGGMLIGTASGAGVEAVVLSALSEAAAAGSLLVEAIGSALEAGLSAGARGWTEVEGFGKEACGCSRAASLSASCARIFLSEKPGNMDSSTSFFRSGARSSDPLFALYTDIRTVALMRRAYPAIKCDGSQT